MGFEDISDRRGAALPRRREAAAAHFRRLGETGSAAGEAPAPALRADPPCRFDIYRADEVRTGATRFSGGDWHWRLSDGAGNPLVDAGGYRNEDECRKAVLVLRNEAALATMAGAA